MKISNSYHWLVGLLALPMFMISQPILATDYVTTFASVSTDFGLLKDVTGSQEAAWSYTATSGVSGPYYSEGGMSGLSFTLPINSNSTDTEVNSQIDDQQEDADLVRQLEGYGLGLTSLGQNLQESLSMTSCRSFSGLLQTIKVSCQYIDGLEIQAYYMEHGDEILLGTLWYNQNAQSYTYSNLKTVDVLDGNNIKLVFSVNVNYSSNYNSLQVYGLSGVTVSVNEPLVPQTNGQIVSFNPSVFGSADLTNFQYNGILFTLNMSSDGDGFEVEDGEGVIYLATTNTDTNVEYLAEWVEDNTYIPGSESYALEFSGGITLKVPAGSGYLRVDAQTEGNYVLHVRIGNKRVVEISNTKRRISEIPYKVDKETYVYVYLTQTASGSRGTRIGKRGAAHGKIYSFCSSTAPETTSLSFVIPEGGKLAMVSPYDLDFSSLEAKGVKAYICTGYELASKTFWLTRVNDVPANTPILVKGVKGASTTYTVPVTTSRIYYPENFLVGSAMEDFNVDKSEGFLNYVVTKSQGTIASMPGGTSVLAAGKAYFHVPADVASNVASAKQEFKMGVGKKLLTVSDYDLDFTKVNGLKAYVVTAFDLDRTIWLSRVMKASAGTPLLLRGEQSEGVYNVPSVATKMAYVNMLVGNTSSADVTISPEMDGCVIYVLQLSKGTFATIGKDASMAKGKAWLPVPKSFYSRIPASRGAIDVIDQESEVICIKAGLDGEDDGTTSIRRVDSSQFAVDSDVWYNLKGQRVAIPTKKGLYINNGKKVFIR